MGNSTLDPFNLRKIGLSVRPSILNEVTRVKEQVEFYSLGKWIKDGKGGWRTGKDGKKLTYTDPIYAELCLIIAEVNLLDLDAKIKIAGIETSAHIVQEVFTQIRSEHLEAVVSNFQRVYTPIYNKKSYLRTSLYNVVFELETGLLNE
jgi:hypothetical protein